MERGADEESVWRSDGATEVEGGLEMPVAGPSVRAKEVTEEWRGKKSQII